MAEHVELGARRARYRGERLGAPSDEARAHAPTLAEALAEMERLGLAPVLDDGAVAGNGAMRLPGGTWIASASGRRAGDAAVVEIVAIDTGTFTVTYRSDEDREPTSDIALHLAALSSGAAATLHGHALESAADASRLGLPISDHETPFGTLEDLTATEALLSRAPYPAHRAWIRRGHGFLVGAATMDEARALVRSLAAAR